MKNKNLIYGIILLILVATVVFLLNTREKLPSQISGQCGIESCNGLDITCGPNVPDQCLALYSAGDSCRQYVNCQNVNGQCTLEKSAKFDSCKSCIEKCELESKNDPENFSQCESSCIE